MDIREHFKERIKYEKEITNFAVEYAKIIGYSKLNLNNECISFEISKSVINGINYDKYYIPQDCIKIIWTQKEMYDDDYETAYFVIPLKWYLDPNWKTNLIEERRLAEENYLEFQKETEIQRKIKQEKYELKEFKRLKKKYEKNTSANISK